MDHQPQAPGPESGQNPYQGSAVQQAYGHTPPGGQAGPVYGGQPGPTIYGQPPGYGYATPQPPPGGYGAPYQGAVPPAYGQPPAPGAAWPPPMYAASPKSRTAALILCIFLGWLGIHRFYAGKAGTGILYLFTMGLFGIGVFVDFIMILCGSFRDNYGYQIQHW